MKRRGEGTGDSFDMLLDTMCNTFGGVCFIALMISITSVLMPDGEADGIREAERMATDREVAKLVRERDELKSAIRLQREFVEKSATNGTAIAISDLAVQAASNTAAVTELRRRRQELEDEFAKRTTDVEYSRREHARLKRLLKDMEESLESKSARRSRTIRTPVERALAGYRPVDVWLKGSVMYVLHNEAHCKRREWDENGEKNWGYTVQPGGGFRMGRKFLNSREFKSVVEMVTGKKYMRIFSDVESYTALCEIRDELIALRKPYNWHLGEETELKFIEGVDENVQ